ncbi:hypothetical protein GQ607_016379 [Colletotrichum asianum]|uniref:Uncharacterized protein n=1 Tax=Colletotrichum asianum TaxID=702518 RepID=A0A8H3ZEQ9_9PEZI|nr:hypothetical protein GQ607_016379 [Colletotrichum asianum]
MSPPLHSNSISAEPPAPRTPSSYTVQDDNEVEVWDGTQFSFAVSLCSGDGLVHSPSPLSSPPVAHHDNSRLAGSALGGLHSSIFVQSQKRHPFTEGPKPNLSENRDFDHQNDSDYRNEFEDDKEPTSKETIDAESEKHNESVGSDLREAFAWLPYLNDSTVCLAACEVDGLEGPVKQFVLGELIAKQWVILPIHMEHDLYWAVAPFEFCATRRDLNIVHISASSTAGFARAEQVATNFITLYLPHLTPSVQRCMTHVASSLPEGAVQDEGGAVAFVTSVAFALGARLPATVHVPLWRQVMYFMISDDPASI